MMSDTPALHARRLTLADIADTRAYERERAEFRGRVADLKQRRRCNVGPVITLLFENRDTIRFQIQEMARVERLITDEAIQEELDTYNPLVPAPGSLRATLFIELTNDDEMQTWLPALVGVEQSVVLRLDGGGEVRCTPDPQHASQLTREYVTAAVHYIGFELSPAEVASFARGAVVAIDHPAYRFETALSASSIFELLTDLRS